MSLKVSVLIDTYNHEKYIASAIDSVLMQEEVDLVSVDIVVIDDGSTDKTADIVGRFGSAVRYYWKPNGGQASAFNMGIPLCEGEIICFLDGDDWWHPHKMKTVINTFEENPTICGIGHGFIEVDEVAGNWITFDLPERIRINFDSSGSAATFRKCVSYLGTSRLSMRRSSALALLEIPKDLVFEADEYMFTLLPTLGVVVVLPDALTYYRIHGANLYQDSRTVTLRYHKDSRLGKRAAIYACLAKQLPNELRKRGCEPLLVELLVGPVQVEASRLKLMTRGGSPLENFRSEYRARVLSERRTAKSLIVLWLSLVLALVSPPKYYFRIRQTYSNLLRRGVLYWLMARWR